MIKKMGDLFMRIICFIQFSEFLWMWMQVLQIMQIEYDFFLEKRQEYIIKVHTNTVKCIAITNDNKYLISLLMR